MSECGGEEFIMKTLTPNPFVFLAKRVQSRILIQSALNNGIININLIKCAELSFKCLRVSFLSGHSSLFATQRRACESTL